MNKDDLEWLADIRIKDAKVLLDSQRYEGAYYLAGYAIECALKACIAKQVRQFDFPDKHLANKSHTHKLSDLLKLAGLNQKLREAEQQNLDFNLNWALVNDWSESSRYECGIDETRASQLFEAITDEESGVLQWLKNYL